MPSDQPTSAAGVWPDEVWPARVVGQQIAHLATVEIDDDGGTFRAICPGADRITALELMPDGAVFIWCPSCREWAAEVGVELPRAG